MRALGVIRGNGIRKKKIKKHRGYELCYKWSHFFLGIVKSTRKSSLRIRMGISTILCRLSLRSPPTDSKR